MRRVLRVAMQALATILCLLLAYVGFVQVMRLVDATPERQAAMDALAVAMPPLRDDKNAYAQFWLADYDVPPGQKSAVMAEDVERHRRVAGALGEEAFESIAKQRYPALPDLAYDSPGLCRTKLDCLATVRTNMAASTQLLATHSVRLANGLALTEFAGIRNPFVAGIWPLPMYSEFNGIVRTHFAVQFAQGRQHDAVAGLCRDLAAQRRFGTNTDLLIAHAAMTSFSNADLALLAEMLADYPAGLPWPADCAQALAAPMPGEASLCSAMRGEFVYLQASLATMATSSNDSDDRRFRHLLAIWPTSRHVAELRAPLYAAACSDVVRSKAMQGQAWRLGDPPESHCTTLEKVADPPACLLAEIGHEASDFTRYQDRRVDALAKVNVLRSALWLRDHANDGRTVADRWQQRPDDLRTAAGKESLSADGRTLLLPLLDVPEGDPSTWKVRLPGS